MSTKFFTNDGSNTLLNKLEGIFQHMDVYFFDAVIGYFRASGYFRIYKFLHDVEEIRFLVGINVDDLTWKAHSHGLEFRANRIVTQEEYLKKLVADIQSAEYKKDVEEGMLSFIEDIASGKIQIKAHPSKSLHAKVYIFRQKVYHPHASYGAVITGSSNLTDAGLEKNFEFNVELRDHDDIMFASETFEKLWLEGVAISPEIVLEAKKNSYLNTDFTPFELYIKFLTEYFGKSIEYDPDDFGDLPPGYMHLLYQQDAVNDGYKKLMNFNGFFLADVVGLGKTIVACQIAKKFANNNGTRTKTLIVHPPALKSNWEKTVRDFDLFNISFCSNGSLHKIKHPEDFDLVIVDEAHKFRTDTSDMFHNLQVLCKTPRRNPAPNGDRQKKVILVSATPLNNKPEDIRNLILLFQDGRNSTLEISNLIGFFRPLIDAYNEAKFLPTKEAVEKVKAIYEKIRNKILEPVIIRRTRTDIVSYDEYKKDIEKQGLRFPDISPPEPIFYQLDTELNRLYDSTIKILQDSVDGFKYYRYQAISHLKKEFKDRYARAEDISRQLSFIMKTLLIKRLDSSFHSFVISLEKYRTANRAMLKMFANNAVHIAPSLNVSEYIVNEKEDELIAKMEVLRETDPSVVTYGRDAFLPDFEDGLKHDQQLLDILCGEWHNWQEANKDPKLEELLHQLKIRLLNPDFNKTNKLVIFSEYKDTTDYLKTRLTQAGYTRLLAVDSSNVTELAPRVEGNFDARLEPSLQKDDIDIIITTEVLAEGVNLHRSHTILNYDTPWNSTRLMQRIGRINRIGTTAKTIHVYNFYPTEQTENEIALKKKAIMKLQAFHSALGEDSQIYSSEEEFGTFGLFEKEVKEERDERVQYLLELRKFRHENPEWFAKIRMMPKRARTCRQNKRDKGASVMFLKNDRRDGFYYVNLAEHVEEMTFLECANIFKAYQSETGYPLPQPHHQQVQLGVAAFEQAQLEERAASQSVSKYGPNEKRAIAWLSYFARWNELPKEERERIETGMEAIKAGKFQKLPREINKLQKAIEKASLKPIIAAEKILEMLGKYPQLNGNGPAPDMETQDNGNEGQSQRQTSPKDKPQIIISESFI